MRSQAVSALYEIIGDDGAMTGSAVSTALATESTVSEIRKITVIAVLFLVVILTLTTISWLEPWIVLVGLGVAIVLNAGSNLIFGEISFVTNAAGNILQLAVSSDYSVFLIHRFEEYRQREEPEEAMVRALILSTSSVQLGATVDYAILLTERYKENRMVLGKKESISETISNVTVSILTSGIALTVIGFLLGVISSHGLLSQLGYFLGRGTLCSMAAVLFVLPCFLYVADGIIHRKK